MTVRETIPDAEALTLTFVTEFDAPVERVWRVWSDPRRLERWWGPPTWPATFERLDFVPGGAARYHMTGPDGTKARGWWSITAIDEPYRLEYDDGFAGDDGEPLDADQPMHAVVTLERAGDRTRMTVVNRFADAAQFERLMTMGMAEGMGLALGQIDELLRAA
ncbi:activator of HSP90 ATPase [Actinoplanes sp. SE50]|uniref:SRPBCC family protein n=1 Tax=unclassified Actinoplanes TaxID=2626549 RepID=UPI00023ED0D0|nr:MULTISPECIES: SRPBCC domain-containing protein [unclassified Actinoplanes]AEV86086.1 activator of HSP90 ATPase 1 family protein [Actinoplanes sp. SE50/110]ATO84484.1 activator of HSP90 ATPase [Actinoplanes sp. SE50]SLM01894.1 activator of HSP90 ATPase [Actinoplanes sp. SE50/110]